MKKVILIGDSIRMGYEPFVQTELEDVAEVLASDQNGGDSRNVLRHLGEWVIQMEPDVIHINCGLHDLKKAFGSNDAAVPLVEYESNVREILERVSRETDAVVIWATTTPVNQARHHENKSFDRYEDDVRAYNKSAISIAGQLGVAINDLFAAVTEAGCDRLLGQDGVHFTEGGSSFLGKTVADFIRPYVSHT